MLKSETMNEKIKHKKLIITNSNCKNVNDKILVSNLFELLKFLYEHSITPEFTCRFSWTPNAIAIWDNRCTQHKPINDYFPAHRLLERITVDGDTPY